MMKKFGCRHLTYSDFGDKDDFCRRHLQICKQDESIFVTKIRVNVQTESQELECQLNGIPMN